MPQIVPVDRLTLPELTIFTQRSEQQLRHYFEPEEGLFLAESPLVISRALDAGYEPFAMLIDARQVQTEPVLERVGNIPVYAAPETVLRELTGFPMLRGAVCAMRRKPLPSPESICRGGSRIAVLEHVVNPTNVGAIMRSAAALYMDAVLLTPSCSDPLYRRAARVSMGTVFQVPWTYLGRDTRSGTDIARLHAMGFRTASMALTDQAISIDDAVLCSEERLAVILGTEGEGLQRKTIAACDYTVRIPMAHGVDSLNVAAASAVAFWQLGRRYSSDTSS